jgi:hypothetical protein
MGLFSSTTNKIANSQVGGDIVAILQKGLWLKNIFSRPSPANGVIQYETVTGTPSEFWPGGVAITTRFQETYTFQAEVTRFAIESGAIVSDHVIVHPARVDLSFEVNNWEGYNKPKKSLEDFIILQFSRKPVDLVTQHKILPNMVCSSIQVDNSVPEWGKLSFRASFQEIKFAELETVKYPSQKVGEDSSYKMLPSHGGPATGLRGVTPKNMGSGTPRIETNPNKIYKSRDASGSW